MEKQTPSTFDTIPEFSWGETYKNPWKLRISVQPVTKISFIRDVTFPDHV
jgi:hypothetical protein